MQIFPYRRKCIGYKSVQHYSIRRAIQKKKKITDHVNCDRNKSRGHWHWGWSGAVRRRKEGREKLLVKQIDLTLSGPFL